jgi:spoIIIJ-associated protein
MSTSRPAAADEPQSEALRAQGQGETVSEAKWQAMKELEGRLPGLTVDYVRFEVSAEPGSEGAPARVTAEADVTAWQAAGALLPEEPAERVRSVVGRILQALGLRGTVAVDESSDEIRATVNGEDLGLLIGKHGTTIDAVQQLATRIAFKGRSERKHVIVDAAGYRERRSTALQRMADRAVQEALSYGRAVELEPMRASERKIVHLYLRGRADIQTHSEGEDPDRRLVVTPVRPRGHG